MNQDHAAKSASNQGVQVIARAAEILRVLKQDNRGLSLGQISDRVGLPRSTVQRIVNALLAEKLIMNTAAEGGLRLGPEIQSLAAAGRIDAAELLRPVLQDIAESCGETVDLAVFRTDHMVFVDQVVGTHRVRTVSFGGRIWLSRFLGTDLCAVCPCALLSLRKIQEADCRVAENHSTKNQRPDFLTPIVKADFE